MQTTLEIQHAPAAKSRTYKALLGAFFSYGQFFVALLASFFIVPLILRTLGARQYGLWLSSGELLGYIALLDFGVFAILPWLVARADGGKNVAELKRHMTQALALATFLSIAVLLIFFALWRYIPEALHLTATDWRELAGPLCLLVVLLGASLPLNIFAPLLGGLQDVRFLGGLSLLRALLCPALTAGLLLAGHRLYALAAGTAMLTPVWGVAAFLRARKIAPEVMGEWPRPTLRDAFRLFRESVGGWLAGAGVQMMERSSGLVLTFLHNPAIVPVLVCTSRMGQILTQMAWLMPDSSLVGLAQLTGENNGGRTPEVSAMIIRLNLIMAGWAACLVLAVNPAFVRIWVGQAYFGGPFLNLLLAAEVISGSLVHGLCTVVAVQGNRLAVGMATLLQGALYIGLALILTRRFSLSGLLTADLLAPLFSTVPVSLWLLRSSRQLDLRRFAGATSLFLYRASPCLVGAGAYGYWRTSRANLAELTAVVIVLSFIYLRALAAQLAVFPFPARVRAWLDRVQFVCSPVGISARL